MRGFKRPEKSVPQALDLFSYAWIEDGEYETEIR